MRKVTMSELLPLGAYEELRPRFRARMIAHKRDRRIFAGQELSLVFEDHDTVLLQVQEMLRAERITTPSAVRHEVDTYNDLIAPDGALLATLMLEVIDPDERERRRRELVGLDDAVTLRLGPHAAKGEFDALGRFDDRIAAVRFVTFRLPHDARALLLDPAVPASLVVDHPNYQARVELTETTRRSLASDLDPENAQASA